MATDCKKQKEERRGEERREEKRRDSPVFGRVKILDSMSAFH
jgi:hypothetical protein